ncbi:MAG: hypothetical protein KAQ98_04545 [Bacteriovoracaceae bacterium]|nr:hypothetical protein [Bacteriovoracaceae bacterium]
MNPLARPFIPLRRDIKGKKIAFKDTIKKMHAKKLLFSGKFNLPAYLTVGASGAPLMRYIGHSTHDIQGVGLSRSTVVESSLFSDRKVLDTLISEYLKKYPNNASSKKSDDKIKHAIGDVKWNLYQDGSYGQVIELSEKFKNILGCNNLSFGNNRKKRDEYRQSGDDYLDSGDDYLDSEDNAKYNNKKKKSPIKKINKEVIIKLSGKPGLYLDSKNIFGFVIKKKWRKGKPINIYANNESIYMLQELVGKYNIKPIYAYSDISEDKVEPLNLFNMRYPVKDSIPPKAEKICNGKMEICTTLKVNKKNQEIEIIIEGIGGNRISKKIILDKYGHVKDKKQNYFSPWLMVKGDNENYLIDIKGLYFLDINTVTYPLVKEKKYSRSKKMEIVRSKNNSRLLISKRKFGEKLGASPENFSFQYAEGSR